jgi:hypothetical protein
VKNSAKNAATAAVLKRQQLKEARNEKGGIKSRPSILIPDMRLKIM